MAGDDLLLPDGSVLLHVGPQKTGTTMLQGALFEARPEMARHGVIYAGERRQHLAAADYVSGDKTLAASRAEWELLVEQVAASSGRQTVVSSEGFADTDAETGAMVVEALGGSRVHVLVTLRPLAKILPSAWQQYVRNRQPRSYHTWLDRTLNRPLERQPTPTFWHRHAHDVLVQRWASIVGPENLTVVVLDDSDKSAVLRAFEGLVGLPDGLLQPDSKTNRSLTRAEIEMVRQLNLAFRERGWSRRFYHEMIQYGAVKRLQAAHAPGPEEPRITTPKWALDRAAEIGARAAKGIEASGVRVVGDLSVLGAVSASAIEPENGSATPVLLPPDAAAEAILGTIRAGLGRQRKASVAARRDAVRKATARQAAARKATPAARSVQDHTSAELVSVLLRRGRRRLRRDLRRLRNR